MNNAGNWEDVCKDIFNEMKDENIKMGEAGYGFHFTYSPKKSWNNPYKDILVLTCFPSAWNKRERKNESFIPPSPWPEENEFLNSLNSFPHKREYQTILAEIASVKSGKKMYAQEDDKEFGDFVDDNMILASLVPFRVPSGSNPSENMDQFARERYWGRLLRIWRPGLIVASGKDAFSGMAKILEEISGQTPEIEERPLRDYYGDALPPKCNDKFSLAAFRHPDGKITQLLGVPSPSSWYWSYIYPTNSGKFGSDNAPIQRFIREEAAKVFK